MQVRICERRLSVHPDRTLGELARALSLGDTVSISCEDHHSEWCPVNLALDVHPNSWGLVPLRFVTPCASRRITITHVQRADKQSDLLQVALQAIEIDAVCTEGYEANCTDQMIQRSMQLIEEAKDNQAQSDIEDWKHKAFLMDLHSGRFWGDCCSVCMEPWTTRCVVVEFPCGHVFHYDCISSWRHKSNLCPLDKKVLKS